MTLVYPGVRQRRVLSLSYELALGGFERIGEMGFRFFKRFRLMPGLTLNLSKSGPSISVGKRGAHLTLGAKSVTRTVSLPGTGIRWTKRTNNKR